MQNTEAKKIVFAQACILINTEYSSVARHNCIATYLHGLQAHQVLEEDRKMTDTLELVQEEPTELAPQRPRPQRGEMNTIEFLRNAVLGHLCAVYACSRTSAGELGFQQFYNLFETATQQESEERAGRLRDRRTFHISTADQTCGISEQHIMYTVHYHYAHIP